MLQIGSIDIVKYEYLGLGQTVIQKYVQPATDVQYTLATGSGVNQYDGLDRSQSFERGEISDSYTATWDAWNRLVELTDDADSDKSVAQYEYDGLNRRIIKRSYTSGTLSETRHQYYSSQWQVVEERVGTSTIPDKQFVWGQRYVDDLLLRDEGGNRLYALQDAQFNVVAITADTGSVEQRFAYQAYGQSESLNADFTAYSGTDYAWEYRYTGRELDLNTRLQLNRNRYLHLQLGRWCSRDPIGYEDGWNLYRAYFVINRVDPTGLGVATIDYGPCISLRGVCSGTCTCSYIGSPSLVLQGAMIAYSYGCCMASCLIGDCSGGALQSTAMMACIQTNLRNILPIASLPWTLSCTCT